MSCLTILPMKSLDPGHCLANLARLLTHIVSVLSILYFLNNNPKLEMLQRSWRVWGTGRSAWGRALTSRVRKRLPVWWRGAGPRTLPTGRTSPPSRPPSAGSTSKTTNYFNWLTVSQIACSSHTIIQCAFTITGLLDCAFTEVWINKPLTLWKAPKALKCWC